MKKIMFIAGEASGDNHAAALIRALGTEVQTFGAGGPQMQAAGMELLLDLTEHAVVGIIEALKNYRNFRRLFLQLLAEAKRRQPDAVVLVDFPGFNLRFARAVKRELPRTKVIYYISPQVWAWHSSRAKQIERDVDLMLTIFPFEKAWYADHAPKLRVEFVGHPFVDTLHRDPAAQREDDLVLLLPGSRDHEVAHIFPILAKVVDLFPPHVRFVAAAVNEATARMIQHPRVTVEIGGAHRWMQRARLTIAASGTATMELAYFACPMVVVYHVNWITYLIGRLVVHVKWIAMPNLIAGRGIIPEFIQEAAQPSVVAQAARELMATGPQRAAMEQALAEVVASLGQPGASDRAAKLILGAL
jgi:lipid-A-disaccharide synthase